MIVSALWALPLVWAIVVANVRRAAGRDEIVAMAVILSFLSFGCACLFYLSGSQSMWMDPSRWDLLALLPYGCTWVAVVWAHFGASIKMPSLQRGFPIEPDHRPKNPDT
jgi:hypothetical protein